MVGRLDPEVPASNHMMKRFLHISVMLLCLAFLTACVLTRETQDPIHTYVLDLDEGTVTRESRHSLSVELPSLLMSMPEPAPGHESQGMVYEQVPHKIRYFATSQWVQSPARMLAPLIVQRLEKSGLWSSVVQTPTSVRGDFRLEVGNVALVQEFLQQPSRVRLALRAQLTTIHDPGVIGTRNFEIFEEALSEDAYGGVLAAQRVVRRFLDELIEWLDGCLHGSQSQPC